MHWIFEADTYAYMSLLKHNYIKEQWKPADQIKFNTLQNYISDSLVYITLLVVLLYI